MKYLDEYRAAGPAQALLDRIRKVVTRPWTLMEVCGGRTHNLMAALEQSLALVRS